MTDKRLYELVHYTNKGYFIKNTETGNEWFQNSKSSLECVVNELNTLHEENGQLKEINQELYDFRLVLNALLFNEWAETGKYEVYKSKRHHDGEPCFDGEWFIVVAILPSGQVTNHYHIKYWDYFKIPSYEKVKDEFDGHTSSVVLLRYGWLLE